MLNAQKDQLFTLVKSLNKSEKRNFRLYATRLESGNDTKFLQLFDVLDKLTEYDEALLLKKLPEGVKKAQLPNLKRHLYKQLLISLRLIYIHKNIDIEIREQIDFARILYGKGMYMQALKLLERIKRIALDHHQDVLHLEVLEFQKLIEARHITRSRQVKNKMEDLLEESLRRSYITLTASKLSNFNIQVQGWYIQFGHAKNDREAQALRAFFEANLPGELNTEKLTFFERINLHQSYFWYHYVLLDFQSCRHYTTLWVELFEAYPQMKDKDPDLYMRGLYYVLMAAYFLKDLHTFQRYLLVFERFAEANQEQFNTNSGMVAFVYLHLSKLNFYYLTGQFEEGLAMVPEILETIPQYEALSDIHRILLFHYKIAYLWFGCGKFEKALEYLNQIIHLKGGSLREDLHFNARLLHLLCHYESGHYDLIAYLSESLHRSSGKSEDIGKLQKAALQFVKKLARTPLSESRAAFERFHKQALKLAANPYEQKAALYLDLPLWAESHLLNCSISELTRKKKQQP